ncbi:DeoR/GlpR family DNA-binding transcription regulator [Rhodococcus sp. NPDC059968]|uniref:DeoR/GlpR family DNA-binding transcription regulator n=1 Tax=Rhodococcus sp. NPDC059968 TaxID=3347017 RepID=UPI00366A9E92
MFSQDRHRQILAQVEANSTLSALDAARALGVSTETIRRDLAELENRGLLRRVHGGAVSLTKPPAPEQPHNTRTTINAAAKRTIGMLAAQLITTERTLFIDAGTTTQQLARAISRTFIGTVVTSSMLVATELLRSERVKVLVAPGFVQFEEPSLSGTVTNEFLRNYHYDLAFISCSGMSGGRGVTDYKVDYASLSRTVIENSDRNVLLADSSKDGRIADAVVCDWEPIADLVTEKAPSADTTGALVKAVTNVVYPRPRKG